MELKVPKTLSPDEKDFCELFVCGCEPYKGDARRCYEDVFKDNSNISLGKAKTLMAREDVADYISQLQKIAHYETAEMKSMLTEKLLKIVNETSTAVYTDRRGTKLSPAPLRSVAVQATKALMEMYPIKVAQESKLEINGNGEQGGITFNVIVPEQAKKPDIKE